MKKSVLILSVLMVLVLSCNKDNYAGNVQLLESISHGNQLYCKFEYDIKNRISKIIYYDSEISSMSLLTYNNVGDLISQKWISPLKEELTQMSGKCTSAVERSIVLPLKTLPNLQFGKREIFFHFFLKIFSKLKKKKFIFAVVI